MLNKSPFSAGVHSVGCQAGLVRWSGDETSNVPSRRSAGEAVGLLAEA